MKKLIILLIIIFGGWYLWKHYRHPVQQSIQNIKKHVVKKING